MDTFDEDNVDPGKVIKFLKHYGYLEDTEVTREDSSNELSNVVIEAIVKFHAHNGLEETGLLDEATLEEMMKPRCGFKIKERTGDDVMKYTIMDKWDKHKLTWKITKYPQNNLSKPSAIKQFPKQCRCGKIMLM